MAEPLLEVRALCKSFGAVAASDKLSLALEDGEIHAVIGPNGAGKTTLIAQICGELALDSGLIRFAGRDINGLPPHRRARLGLARSFQITSIFPDFTVAENVAFALQGQAAHSFRFWRPAADDLERRQATAEALTLVGLADRGTVIAGQLSHGEHRLLELAMALARRPRLLLLDEPMAGLGSEESARMVGLLGSLRGTTTMLLVEHDMDAVFALADRITVLVYGQVIASGAPDRVRADPAVRAAYLGTAA